ncbi:molybdopterin cofactor-binding domain-containing protein, partial [Sporichthya sp.]|uniref:xanthine dehydrogenase family protein molybdopterin-binding subunit n=1 Tax=Sporichthya sp. TaxID=65475 RepID=UPI001848FA23
MLHAALTRSPHAHAAILGVDTATALASPGVVDVLTAADLPGQLCHGPIRADRPVLAAGVVRHVGEPVAAVLATDPLSSTRAAAAVGARYRTLPEVHWFRGAQADPLHPDGNLVREVRVRRGQWPADPGLVVEGAYNTHGWVPRQEPFGTDGAPAVPALIEAQPTDDGVQISAPRRWHPTDRDQLAQCLGLTPRQIELTSTGGTDHSTDLGGAVVAATFARRNHRPVCLMVGPPMFGQGGGPVIALRYRHHARPDGTLVAVHAEIDLESGPYAGLAEALVAEFCAVGTGPYRVPAVDLRVRALRSTTPPPMLEPGLAAAAVAFAVEAQLDRLADLISFEQGREAARFPAARRAVRQRNLLGLDDPLPTGQILLEDSPVAALLTALDATALPERPDLGDDHAWGVGIGAGILPFGLGEAVQVSVRAEIRVGDGKPVVACPAAEGDEHLEAAAVGVVEQALGAATAFAATGAPAGGGSAASIGPSVQAALDALTRPARERIGTRAGMSAELLRVVDGRVRSFDAVVDVPLAEESAGDPDRATGEYATPATEMLDEDGQGDAFSGFGHAAARATVLMSAGGDVEIVQVVVAADCGRVLDPE